jgi:ankyrin repeat protein
MRITAIAIALSLFTALTLHATDLDTQLLLPIAQGDAAAVRSLLSKGVSANARMRGEDKTLLILAASLGHVRVVDVLIAGGADVSAKDERGMTALSWAALLHHLPILQLLINSGADVNTADKKGTTALMWAVVGRDIDVMRVLLDKGATWTQEITTAGQP